MQSEDNVLQATSLIYIRHTPILLFGLGTTFSSPENPAMVQELLTSQLSVSKLGKYSPLRNVNFNCLNLL